MKNISKKTKLSLLGVGTLAAAALPIAAVVSCGTSYVVVKDESGGSSSAFDNAKVSEIKLQDVDLTKLASLKTAFVNAGITLADLNALTPEEWQHSTAITPDADAKSTTTALYAKIRKVMMEWSFDHNADKEAMQQLNIWIKRMDLGSYSSTSYRGPWKSDASKGSSSYYRNDLFDKKTVPDFDGYDLVGSKFTTTGIKSDLVSYNTISNATQGSRIIDGNMVSGNAFSSTVGSNTAFSIFRSKRIGTDEYTTDPDTGEINWTSKESDETTLFKGLTMKIGGTAISSEKFEDVKASLSTAPSTPEIEFDTKGTINYAKAQGGHIVDSSVKFEAKDLFYGLMRSVYASNEFRTTGKINGADVTSVIPRMTAAELKDFRSEFEDITGKTEKFKADKGLNNENLYLLDLYGIDLIETIKANTNADNTKFVLKFKAGKLKPDSLTIFKNNSLFTPFSHTMLTNVGTKASLSATSLRVHTYGNPFSGTGTPSVDGILSLAPFLHTTHGYAVGDEQKIEQNPFYIDQTWVHDNKSVKSFVTTIESSTQDATSKSVSRKNFFLDAAKTGAYILDPSVTGTSLEDLSKYKVTKSLAEHGVSNAKFWSWNQNGYHLDGAEGYNDKGREMMWGQGNGQISKINTSSNALWEFYTGNGSLTRASIHAAVNWYTMAQTIYPNQGKVFWPRLALPGNFTDSGLKVQDAQNVYSADSYENPPLQPFPVVCQTDKDIYLGNYNNKDAQWKAASFMSAAKTIDKLADSVGATAANPAQIPIFRYQWGDTTITPQQDIAHKMVLKTLNKLSPKVKFVNEKMFTTWSSFLNDGYRPRHGVAMLTAGFGPDYEGLGSIFEQELKPKYSFGAVALAKWLLETH